MDRTLKKNVEIITAYDNDDDRASDADSDETMTTTTMTTTTSMTRTTRTMTTIKNSPTQSAKVKRAKKIIIFIFPKLMNQLTLR